MKGFIQKVLTGVSQAAVLAMASGLAFAFPAPRFTAEVICYGADGVEKWRDVAHNLVTTVGKNDLLNTYFGATAKSTYYVGLKGAGSAAAADTAASHAGWSEIAAYSEATRQALTVAAASAGSVTNSASKAVFTINGSATVAGAFLITNNTKSGTTGTLYSAGDFSGGSRSVQAGDTLSVTMTLTAA